MSTATVPKIYNIPKKTFLIEFGFNPFVSNAPFLYPLKTSKKRSSDVFRG